MTALLVGLNVHGAEKQSMRTTSIAVSVERGLKYETIMDGIHNTYVACVCERNFMYILRMPNDSEVKHDYADCRRLLSRVSDV